MREGDVTRPFAEDCCAAHDLLSRNPERSQHSRGSAAGAFLVAADFAACGTSNPLSGLVQRKGFASVIRALWMAWRSGAGWPMRGGPVVLQCGDEGPVRSDGSRRLG